MQRKLIDRFTGVLSDTGRLTDSFNVEQIESQAECLQQLFTITLVGAIYLCRNISKRRLQQHGNLDEFISEYSCHLGPGKSLCCMSSVWLGFRGCTEYSKKSTSYK